MSRDMERTHAPHARGARVSARLGRAARGGAPGAWHGGQQGAEYGPSLGGVIVSYSNLVHLAQGALIVFIALAAIDTFVFTNVANADTLLPRTPYGLLVGPDYVDEQGSFDGDMAAVCYANSSLLAAYLACGESQYDERFTSDVKAKLSNADTGGRFYELAQAFVNNVNAAEVGMGSGNPMAYLRFGISTYQILYGSAYVYLGQFNKTLYDGAKQDLQTILNGGDLGGGTGGELTTDYIDLSTVYYAGNYGNNNPNCYAYAMTQGGQTVVYNWSSTPNDYALAPSTIRVNISSTFREKLNSFGKPILVTLGNTTATGRIGYANYYQIGFWVLDSTDDLVIESTSGYYKIRSGASYQYNTEDDYSLVNGQVNYTNSNLNFVSYTVSSNYQQPTRYNHLCYACTIINDSPTLPPNDWPEDNETDIPDPPVLPSPPDDNGTSLPDPNYNDTIIVDPTPPQPPTDDPTINEPDPTNPTDYTPWLAAILAQLRNINTTLTTHCVHLQNQMISQATRIISKVTTQIANSVNNLQSLIAQKVTWLRKCIGQDFNNLMTYLRQLFDWLAKQLNFEFSTDPYDDSSVLYWLRQIYVRLGQGKGPSIINNPGGDDEEPFDFWAWLLEMVANVLGGVLGGATDAVRTLLNGIKDKFPFSIPWDIMALLALLDGVRATPVFDVTIPEIQGWWPAVTIHVDLSPYDGVASACRFMVNVWFAMCLLMKTSWLQEVLDGVGQKLIGGAVGKLAGGAGA